MNSRTWIIFHAYCSCSRKGRRRRRKGGSPGWRGRGFCDEVVRLVFAAVELEEKTLTAEEERRRRKSAAGRRKKNCRNREEADFLAYFGPDFLFFQAMQSTSIYRRWKRAIFSTLRKTLSPWFSWEGSQPLAQNRYHELKICRQKLIE